MSSGTESSSQPTRGLALRLRKAIISSFKSDSIDLTTLFHSISEGADTISVDVFKEFAEEMLDIVIKPAEGKALYQLYDTNGDGKVSLTDFLSFINSATFTAQKALSRGSADMVVDMQVSDNGPLDAKLAAQGYSQLRPDPSQTQGRGASAGTFGRGQSIWVWRFRQGTCCGRLKPIIDIQLDTSSTSSAMVISGYTCLGVPIAGQWIWIKRATTQEEEKDAIVEFRITCGKAKVPTDCVWQSPGVGWIRVDGNFNRGIFAPFDAFMWFRPLRSRSDEHVLASPLRDIINFSEENRKAALFGNVRRALRNYVPVDDMQRLAKYSSQEEETVNAPTNFDFAAIYHVFSKGLFSDRMGFSKMRNMLTAVGCPIDSVDMDFCFHTLDMNQNGYISREDFTALLELSPDEQDEAIVFAHDSVYESIKGTSKLKHNQLFVEMFKMINANGDGVLSLAEILNFYAQLGVYLTPSEGRSIMQIMDVKSKDRLEEGDFVAFMSTVARESAMIRRAFRVREASERLRRWLIRSLNLSSGPASSSAQQEPTFWRELRERHHRSRGPTFPGYLSSTDLCNLAARLGHCLSNAEGKQLCLIVAPTKSGRVHQSDLLAFMNSSCRQFGEILALLERDILKPVVEVYRERREALSANDEPKVAELDKEFALILSEIEQTIAATAGGLDADQKGGVADIVSLEQIRSGIQTVMHGYSTPENQTPNVEEWALLSALTGAMVAEGDTYGIKAAKLITGICSHAVGDVSLSGGGMAGRSVFNFEALCRELQALIVDEAKAAAARKPVRPGQKTEKYDFQAVFALFDEDGEGTISLGEFRKMLSRLNILDDIPVDKVPEVLKVFDPKNKSVVTYPNFVDFAMDKRYGYFHEEEDLSDGDFDEEEDELPSSSAVPAAITQNADADWLVWNIWKNAMRRDFKDPERIITDLEASCAEVELEASQGVASDRDMWFILSELNLKEGISKQQFEAGAAYYAIDSKKKLAAGIDFESFCRGIIRMGRAYNAQLQDRKKAETELYSSLKLSLQKEIAALMEKDTEPAVKIPSQRHGDKGQEQNVTKIFRRLDTDGDGKLTVLEFKNALRRLKLNNVKKWSNRMIRRLFEDCDKNKDGRLDLSEFFQFIRDGMSAGGAAKADLFGEPGAAGGLNDDDFEGKSFRAQRVISDNELYRKVMATLFEAVRASSNPNDDHTEVVKATVRKYFKAADPEDKGHVEEERFRAFCRRSGLHDALSTAELRMLTERLRKPSSKAGSASTRINYEKFLTQLSNSASGIPHSMGDAVLTKLQDAVDEASSSGRPFLGLCSLIDPKNRGVISRSELLHTFKMMTCLVGAEDLDALAQILPSNVFLSDGDVNYKELNNALLGGLTPRNTELFANPRASRSREDNLFSGALTPATLPRSRARPSVGALPLYATPKTTTRGALALYSSRGATISTPSGIAIAIPDSARDTDDGTLRGSRAGYRGRRASADLTSLEDIYARVIDAVDVRGQQVGGRFSLKKQLNVYDYENSGYVSLQTFQSTLDDLGVALSAHDLNALMQAFGDPQEDVLDYESFCKATEGHESKLIASRGHAGVPNWITPRIVDRLRVLRREGQNPRDLLELLEIDRSGLVDADTFVDTVKQLRLLQTNAQMQAVLDLYSSSADPELIAYEEFCSDLEKASTGTLADSSRAGRRSAGGMTADRTAFSSSIRRPTQRVRQSPRDDYSDIDDAGDAFAPKNVGKWYAREASPKQRREFDNVFESLEQFRQSNAVDPVFDRRSSSSAVRTSAADFDDFNPKTSDSIRLSGTVGFGASSPARNRYSRYGGTSMSLESPRFGDSTRMSASYRSPSPARHKSPEMPRSPPGKVGTAMWGSHTPLGQKGVAPSMDTSHWVCAVCYYTENPKGQNKCEVCDSANTSSQKDYQLKEQCKNCSFLNGHFASECEMCGKALKRI